LPLTDVLTGLQTGLLDIVGTSPIGALVLQWHTKIKYVTELPLVYTLGFMAIQKQAFGKLSEADQAVVREVMTRTYENFDKGNLVDNRGALDALLNSGVETVEFDQAEIRRIRDVLAETIKRMGEQGRFSEELYAEMMAFVEEFRMENRQAAEK